MRRIEEMFERSRWRLRKYEVMGCLVRVVRHIRKMLSACTPAGIRRRIEQQAIHRERLRIRDAVDYHFDRVHGVDTRGIVEKDKLCVDSVNAEHNTAYQPVGPQAFVETFDQLPVDFREFMFVDFGSGKGRAVLLASEYPFRKIVGIEFSPELHRAAEVNCRKYRPVSQQCREIELLCMDAVEYTILPEPAIFHFYNPFDEVVMSRLAFKTVESLKEHPRQIYIVYFGPTARTVWDQAEGLEAFPIRQPTLPGYSVAVWTSAVRH